MSRTVAAGSFVEERIAKPFFEKAFLNSAFAALLAVFLFCASQAGAVVISSIVVNGNQLIPDETIAGLSGVTIGEDVSPSEANEALRRLNDSGIFSAVEVGFNGSQFVISVQENPTISVIAFEGNRDIADDNLSAFVQSKPRGPLNTSIALADAQRIVSAYTARGRYNVEVEPVYIPVSEGRVNLVFQINESSVSAYTNISFVGNEAFSDSRLRRVIKSNERSTLSFLFGGTTFDAGMIEADKQALREFYTKRGYIDFEVISATAELSDDRKRVFLAFTVSEGFRYDIGAVTVSSGIEAVDLDAMRRLIEVRAGRLYNAADVDDTVAAMEDEADDQGFPFARVRSVYTRHVDERTVDVNFAIEDGPRSFVERLDIRGNTSTHEEVIRREFALVEGDPLNASAVRQAVDRVRGTQIFGTVDVDVREGSSPESAIVTVTVTEQPTGSAGFGGSYSTDNGFSLFANVSESNFLGRGQRFSLDFSLGETVTSAGFSFTEPALFGRDVSGSGKVYYRETDRSESSFQTTRVGIEPGVSFKLSEDLRAGINYRLSWDDIRDIDADTSQIIKNDEGALLTSALGLDLTYDRRNSVAAPTEGYILQISQDLAGLGGDAQYSKTVAKGKIYKGLFDDAVVLSLEAEGGALVQLNDTPSRITDRFLLGGSSLRGFEVGGLGPRDYVGNTDDALGGNFYGVVRLETSFPLGIDEDAGIFGGAFVDAGTVWALDDTNGTMGVVDDSARIRASAGLSLFWATPIGPLEFSYAIPVVYEDYDKLQRFSINIGTRF